MNQIYLDRGALHVERMGRGFAWLDTGTPDSLLQAGEFVRVLEQRQGFRIACPEEIALENGWIDVRVFSKQIERYKKSSYGEYLQRVLSEKIS